MKHILEYPMKERSNFRVICIGDVVGRPGRAALKERLKSIREATNADLVVVNGENAAGGAGIDAGTAREIRDAGADIVTLGDHAFQRKGSAEFIEQNSSWCVRPLNFPENTSPGKGWCSWKAPDGTKVLVVNLMGRVFMGGALDCPFQVMNKWFRMIESEGDAITVCDMHAEATSEKWAMARHVDGRLSLVVGTHTHVQTSDAQVLPGGTGFITDLGMTGSNTGVIGMDAQVALQRFMGPKPAPYEIAEGDGFIRGVVADIDRVSRKAVGIYLLNC